MIPIIPRVVERTIKPVSIFLTLFTVYYSFTLSLSRARFANLVLGIGLFVYFLQQFIGRSSWGDDEGETTTPDSIVSKVDRYSAFPLAILSVVTSMYVELSFTRLRESAPIVGYTQTDIIVGLVVIILVVEATRRAFGKAIPIVVTFTIFYALFGESLPGILNHSGLALRDVARFGAISLTGVYGSILQVGVTWVAIFIMLAGLMKQYRLLEFLRSVATEMRNTLRTGVVLFAVMASMLMGSITGSAAANTATTGSFTIPMLKDQGIRKDFAGAIESVASTGGQMLPPVMGTAAFLMADILSIRYTNVLIAGTIPALLFYFSVAISVYLFAFKNDWITSERSGRFEVKVLLEGIHLLVPLVVLLYTLIEMGQTPLGAGKYTIIAAIITALVKELIIEGLTLATTKDIAVRTVDGFGQGAMDFVPLIGILGAIGLIIRMVEITGLAGKLSLQLLALSGGVFAMVLILTMIAALILGLGMPTPAAYLLVAILVAPAIVEYGVPELSAHLFVFYFAMLSAITPPVAVAVAIGAQIAGGTFVDTAKQTLRIGGIGFLVPFIFIYNPTLIDWAFPTTVTTLGMVLVAITSLAFCIVGHNGFRKLTPGYRLVYLLFGLTVAFSPGVVETRFIAPVVTFLIIGLFLFSTRDLVIRRLPSV